MHTTHLRRVGGSIMLAVPPALLDLLNLGIGAKVDIGIEDGRLVVTPRAWSRYTLEELLAQCDEESAIPADDRPWLDSGPIGKELLYWIPLPAMKNRARARY